jgi:predicted PurR-regulated permease PerM
VGECASDWTLRALFGMTLLYGLHIAAPIVVPVIVALLLALLASPLMVFFSVVVCAWLWGVVGALSAVPLLACSKIVCQHVPDWNRAAIIMGR